MGKIVHACGDPNCIVPRPSRGEMGRQIVDIFSRERERLHLEKRLSDLTIGLRNLRARRPAPWNLEDCVDVQVAKIRSVENKLIALQQGKLL